MMSEWPIWRLVAEYHISPQEIHEKWSLSDVFKANAVLDMKHDQALAEAGKQKIKEDKDGG